MKKINRRSFVKKSTVVTAGIGLFSIIPSKVWGAKVAPSDQINVALIGARSRGFHCLQNHKEYDGTNCVAICDIDSNVLNNRAADVKKKYGENPKLYKDFRKMLEQEDIDTVIIGTPDHWHCLNLVYSVQAGKDVYVEKPMANTIEECNIMVAAANYYNRVVQVGQQQRSSSVFLEVMELIKGGTIGSLRKVNIWANFNYGLGANPAMDGPVPDGVDYDMWLGPAPKRPFNPNRFHGSWRHFWDYGGGMFSDWGVHLIDMGLWVKDKVEAPVKVMSFATNNSSYERTRETFDTMNVLFPTKDYVITYDMTAGVQKGPYDTPYGLSFIGDKATIKATREGYQLIPEWDDEKKQNMVEPIKVSGRNPGLVTHVHNFLDCVKKGTKPNCPTEVGRAAALHAHIANIAARIGEPLLVWDDKNNRFTNCEKANNYIVPDYSTPWELPKISQFNL